MPLELSGETVTDRCQNCVELKPTPIESECILDGQLLSLTRLTPQAGERDLITVKGLFREEVHEVVCVHEQPIEQLVFGMSFLPSDCEETKGLREELTRVLDGTVRGMKKRTCFIHVLHKLTDDEYEF